MDISKGPWHGQARWGLAMLLALAVNLADAGAGAAAQSGSVRLDPPPALPALALAADGLTVSGLSSGGYMAGQFQVAFSGAVAGAAVLAGGPYGCSRGAVSTVIDNGPCPTTRARCNRE